MITRQIFRLTSAAGAVGHDTGRLNGEIRQMRWCPDAADTGIASTLALALLPDMADTGLGFTIYSQSVNLGTQLTKFPRQPSHDPQGDVDQTDTGTPARPVSVVGAGDRLRATVTPGDTGVVIAGNLYVWAKQ